MKKKSRKKLPAEARRYAGELEEEINRDREAHGKNPFDDNKKPPKSREITESAAYPESGVFNKGEHKNVLRMKQTLRVIRIISYLE